MMKLSSPIFFASGDCGCGTGSDPAVVAGLAGALVCDNRYFSLAQGSRMRLLGVTLGSNCQTFLNSEFAGFVYMGLDGQAYVENQPKLTLPAINPAVSGIYPAPPAFKFLQIAGGADPAVWYFLAAPTSGEKVLTAKDGQWLLMDSGAGAAQTAVCESDGAVGKGNIVVCKKTGEDSDGNAIYALRKLSVVHEHILVGDIDGTTGEIGYKPLDDSKPVKHPLSKFALHRSATFKQYDGITGNDETGGMEFVIVHGGTPSIVDALGVAYSPTTGKFYRRAPHVRENLSVDADVVVADNGTYVSMGGHCQFLNKDFNYQNFFLATTIRINAAGTAPSYDLLKFGLFIDGILVNEFDTKNSQNVELSWLHKGLAPGVHSVEMKFKQTADGGGGGTSVMTVRYSSSSIMTLED